MGSSKKHKKEHRHKRKHRSRSRDRGSDSSPDEKRKKHSKKHKSEKSHKHKSRTKDIGTPEKISVKTEKQDKTEISIPGLGPDSPKRTNASLKIEDDEPQGHGDGTSLSIEETNKLRIKLGLKPLDVNGSGSKASEEKKEEFVHAPPENIAYKKKQEDIRSKLKELKTKREINKKLGKIKTLGDDSDEDAAAWVEKLKRKQKEKLESEKREKQFRDMDEAFGVSNLVQNELRSETQAKYTSKNLKGLNVEHSLDTFKEGSTILTLKDADVLGDEEDVLMNPNMEEIEKGKRNIDIKRKGLGYKAYEEEEVDELGFFKEKSVLGQYDEEIDGVRKNRFTIGQSGNVDTTWEKQKELMKNEIRAKGESLKLPELKLASEYFTEEELKIKKRKRKVRKVRKREVLKADDLLPLPTDSVASNHGSRKTKGVVAPGKIPGWDEGREAAKVSKDSITSTTMAIKKKKREVIVDDDDGEDLQRALDKARKAKLKKAAINTSDGGAEKVAAQLDDLSKVKLVNPADRYAHTISLNATDEFCRQLGAQVSSSVPVRMEYTQNNKQADSDMDPDDEDMDDEYENQVVTSKHQEDKDDGHAPIEAEPLAAGGLAGVLQLAKQKGYLNDEEAKKGFVQCSTNTKKLLESQNYSIEDKNAVDHLDKYAHEKYSRDRSTRYDRGMTMDFDEKKNYKPKVSIEYVDEKGRMMSQKEAFRKLSHRFHGKGSGKMKTEKRMKKLNETDMMTKMSSTDTPLNTVAMMKEKLKQESSPFIVLSGAGKTLQAGGPGHVSKK